MDHGHYDYPVLRIVTYSILLLVAYLAFFIVEPDHPDFLYGYLMIFDLFATALFAYYLLEKDVREFDLLLKNRSAAANLEAPRTSINPFVLRIRKAKKFFFNHFWSRLWITLIGIAMAIMNVIIYIAYSYETHKIDERSLSKAAALAWSEIYKIETTHQFADLWTVTTFEKLIHFFVGCMIMLLITTIISKNLYSRQSRSLNEALRTSAGDD